MSKNFDTGELSLDQLENIRAGAPEAMVADQIAYLQGLKTVVADNDELDIERLDNIRAGMPDAIVEDQINSINGLTLDEFELGSGVHCR